MNCKKYPDWRTCLLALPLVLLSCSSSKIFRSAKRELLTDKTIHAAHIGISVYDVNSAKFIFDHQGDQYFVPASNTKIPSCYAAMKYLGDSLSAFKYVRRGNDTIIIEGTGSPDLLHPDFKQQNAFNFLKQFRHIVFSTRFYSEFLGSGWAWNDYKDYYMAQRSEFPVYGNIATFKSNSDGTIDIIPSYFRRSIQPNGQLKYKDGFSVEKTFDANVFSLAQGAAKIVEVPFSPKIEDVAAMLADTLKVSVEMSLLKLEMPAQEFKSRPVDSVLTRMMHRSDNFFAEQMLLMVSKTVEGVLNDRAAIDLLLKTDLASLPQKPRWVDGSGLSRYNLFTPRDFVTILDKMRSEFGMERIKTIFPTGGEGTISSYYQEEKGQIFAKTGTLSGVVALSGYLYTKKGKLLLFSVLVNNHNGSATDVRKAVEKFLRKTRNIN
ncbi:MAG: D-alanyl-D-alanine carboxypeptidase [Chitinophagaceae bacterium]